MGVFVFFEGRRLAVSPEAAVTVGRDADCDLIVSSARVSRSHLRIAASEDEWTIDDISSNGTYRSGEAFSSITGSGTVAVHLGAPDGPCLVVSDRSDVNPDEVQPNPQGLELGASETPSGAALNQELTRFGRAPDNDVVLTGALASAHHAHVCVTPLGVEVIDLASNRGTYVNGERIARALLKPDDRVSMGGTTFVLTSDGNLLPWNETSGVTLEAAGLTCTAGDTTLLHNATFVLPPRHLLAVVGPSGSGKSTLLNALTGLRPATRGQVRLNGRNLYAEYDDLRFQIGLVPQQDLVPTQLKVWDALDYAARLRFPNDTSAGERHQRIHQVIDALGLTERVDLRIDRLSGGQRKRVSVALEMLTQPSVLFLDEPTSGLDPGLDRQVMVILREMADEGRTVTVVTHSVDNLHLADRVLVLAPGGHIAYYGPPDEAPHYFGVTDLASVFVALDASDGAQWSKRWNSHCHSTNTREQATSPPPLSHSSSGGVNMHVSRPRGAFAQFTTLTARNIKVIVADRTYASLLVILPIVLAITGFLVGSAAGLGRGSAEDLFLNPDARLLLMVLVLGSVFTGAATSIQELVKDRVIYQRERSVGLSRLSYVASKAVVLGSIAAVQGMVFALLALAGRPGPFDSLVLPGTLEIAIVVSMATVTSCMLGLFLSSLLPTRDAALPALVIATMVQVVFSGAIPLRSQWLLDVIGWTMPANWEFRAMAASVDLNVLVGSSDATWHHTSSTWWLSLLVLVGMALVFAVATVASIRRYEPGRRS